MKYKRPSGLHTYRFAENPEEQKFYDAWANENDRPNNNHGILDYLLGNGIRPVESSVRDHVVAATVVQWLGSPVGQCFLRDLGYIKKN